MIFCVWISTSAQNNSLSFYSKNTQDGLSNNWVRCVYQDARGFMWFGTASGLNRYDGVNFKHYPLNYANINAIITKDTEHMLICTDLGAYLYNIYNHEFSDFDIQADYPILSVAKDNNGLLWFATSGGLVRYSEHDSVAQLYTYSEHNTSTISNNYCNTVIVDDAGTVWVGTKNGLNRFNASTNTFSRYQMHNTPDLQSNDILALAVDYKQRLWVGTARGGVSVFSNPLSVTLTGTRVFQGNAIALCIDSKNNLWIGRGSGEGLQVINLKDYTSENIPTPIQYKKSVLQKHSLSDNSIFHIYEDSMGDIWIGTFGGGVNYTSKRIKNFHIIEEYYGANKILSSNLINCFYQDSHTLWIGTESGLDEWNMQTNTFRSYMNIPGNSTSLQGNAVYAIHKDSQGTLW
ncbi:MAG TPA: two-component regulator propeller domain-containing protein, partial [Bacteroidales bacterium]|nr:two-component regulator propeller domain-containing protein [Bacteroidales bacterium]